MHYIIATLAVIGIGACMFLLFGLWVPFCATKIDSKYGTGVGMTLAFAPLWLPAAAIMICAFAQVI